jgi:hypothetical protein
MPGFQERRFGRFTSDCLICMEFIEMTGIRSGSGAATCIALEFGKQHKRKCLRFPTFRSDTGCGQIDAMYYFLPRSKAVTIHSHQDPTRANAISRLPHSRWLRGEAHDTPCAPCPIRQPFPFRPVIEPDRAQQPAGF